MLRSRRSVSDMSSSYASGITASTTSPSDAGEQPRRRVAEVAQAATDAARRGRRDRDGSGGPRARRASASSSDPAPRPAAERQRRRHDEHVLRPLRRPDEEEREPDHEPQRERPLLAPQPPEPDEREAGDDEVRGDGEGARVVERHGAHQPDERLPRRPARVLDRVARRVPTVVGDRLREAADGSGHRYGSAATNATAPIASQPAIGASQRATPPGCPAERHRVGSSRASATASRRRSRAPPRRTGTCSRRPCPNATAAGDQPRAPPARAAPCATRVTRTPPTAARGTPGPTRASPGSCT